MKVAMVSEHASPLAALGGVDAGGQNVHVAALAQTIAQRGASVVVHTRRDDPEQPDRVTMMAGVEVDHVAAGPPQPISKDALLPHMDEFARHLRAAWHQDRPDVVHAHFWMSGWAALRAAQPLGIPVVQTFHALGNVKRRYQGAKDTSPPERVDTEKHIIRRADKIIATCTDEVFELIRLGASSPELNVIPCGVDARRFSPTGPREPREGERHRLLFVGRLVERKGIGNIISALPALPDTELVIVGGPDRERLSEDREVQRLTALAAQLGVSPRVNFRGRMAREELPALMRSSDVLVSVPWYEPFGITPLEAMACGIPVVASAVGGLIDTVVDGLTGVHVPPRDPERLATELGALLADPERRAAYGAAGVRRVRRLYDWGRVGAATLDVYARLVRERPRRLRPRSAGRFALPPTGAEHVQTLADALGSVHSEAERLSALGERLAAVLLEGGRVLTVGNGGSAAQAQHLTAELVGRYQTERQPLSALCLHGDTSSLTAIANDYGAEHAFARQVLAHGRPGDVLIALSTSGRSENVLAAVRAASEAGIETWALTGPAPNPLAELSSEAVAFPCPSTATVQELHMVSLHVLCGAVDREVALRGGAGARRGAMS